MEVDEKLMIPYKEKDEGTRLFKAGEFENSSKAYSKALLAINYLFKDELIPEEDVMRYVKEIQIPCLLNLSACYLKMKVNYENVIIHCSDVLNVDPGNPKALYRRGVAHTELSNFEEASRDLKEARRIEPKNNSIYEAQVELKSRIKAYKEKTKKIAQKTFEKKPQPEVKNIPEPSTWTLLGQIIFQCCRRRANFRH
ncbi:unnamed protein product [Blepharisma stoltei]|uniref:peptidylprolyl isomerase n=1 Tax=Blepharisma stoltei TaxID=1481888 RepID=A0AAU9J5J3_9CILI|nr:unnamed protein product [Blepharisma stoltei]